VTNTRCCRYSLCAPDDGWKYHPKHAEQFPDINKQCDVASCWIYEYIGILLGARPILHISKIKVKQTKWTDDDWRDLSQVRDKWLAVVNTTMKPRVPKISLRNY
jgi:hypothetical protein